MTAVVNKGRRPSGFILRLPVLDDRGPALGESLSGGVVEPHRGAENCSRMRTIGYQRRGRRNGDTAVEAIRRLEEAVKGSMIEAEAAAKGIRGGSEGRL